MRGRIGVQVIAGVGVVTTLTIGTLSAVMLRTHRSQLTHQLQRGADQLSETIKRSTHQDMLENRRENLHRQIEAIGRQQGIHRVRLFDKEGVIQFSSDAGEIGSAVDQRTEACFACHAAGQPLERLPMQARARAFHEPDGAHVLGIIAPIENEPTCWAAACHAHSREASVLGVLDVQVPLAEIDAEIRDSQRRTVGLVLSTIAACGLLLFWLNRRLVIGPARALLAGTRRVAEGDLTTKIPVTATHELGQVAEAFNVMTERLADAQRQLTQADKLASVGRLAAGVAHEINNPLTGVLSYASALLKRTADPEARQDLEVVVRETVRCREIVRRLLDFARPVPPRRQPTDLNAVLRQAVAVAMSQLALDRVELTLDLAADLPPAPADGNQIQQVALNLLLNAADAVDGDGRIRVASHRTALAPWGHAPIRRAECPAGCSLLDPATRIGGLPSIRVLRTCAGSESALQLDPIYGRFNHLAGGTAEDGALARYACPRCRAALESEATCPRCKAPMFGVTVRGRGRVLWCTRIGCHSSSWPEEETRGHRPFVEFSVEDSGPGIPAENLGHLFEPFFSTKGTRGTGLGLAVSWGIVEGHGGTIDVDSTQGRGTRFAVRLPLEERP